MLINTKGLNVSANKAFYTSLAFLILASVLLLNLFKKVIPLTINHAIYYCQTFFANTVITLPHSIPSLLVLLLSLVFIAGLFIFIVQVVKMKILVAKLSKNKVTIPLRVVTLSHSLGIVGRVDVVRDRRCLSFCYGFIKPKIILSTQLIKILTQDELKAVLIHEQYHLKNYDPLKIMFGQVATSMFWFLPVIKDLHDHFIILKEFSADQLVVDMQHSTRNLKLALAKVVDYSITPQIGIVSFTNNKGLEARILHLAGNRGKPSFILSLVRLFTTSLVVLFIFVIINIPVYAIETGKNTHSYLICPNSSCAGISSCSKEQIIKGELFSSQPMFTPLKYSSK